MTTFVARSALLSRESSVARRLTAINREIAAILDEYPNLRRRAGVTRPFPPHEAGSKRHSETSSAEGAAARPHVSGRITRTRLQ